MNAEFLEKMEQNRKEQAEKLAGMLEEYVRHVFAGHRELLIQDTREELGRIRAESEQKIGEVSTYEGVCEQVSSWEYADFVNLKIIKFLNALREKKKLCVKDVCSLVFGSGMETDFVEEKVEQEDFKIGPLPDPEPEDQEKLEALKKEKEDLSKEISVIEKEKEDAEAAFRELVRKHAETQAKLEEEKPEIRYITQKVSRKGFFGFVLDLFGKKTETIEDDSERKQWQERVEVVQSEYDAQAREWNGKIEEIRERWKEREEVYDRLDTEERQLEKKLRELLKKAILEDLEACLYGEGRLSDRVLTGVDRDMELNEEKIRNLVWTECQKRADG